MESEKMQNQLEFTAAIVSIGVSDGACVIGFADHDPPEHYVFLQRSLNADSQSLKLDHDKFHVEVDSQTISAYGCLQRAKLGANILTLDIRNTDQHGKWLERITVQFQITPQRLADLAEKLSFIFHGSNCEFSAGIPPR